MTAAAALDATRMARALYLAAKPRNACDPNPRVGCVIDAGGTIVGEGWHRRAGEPHAEIVALDQAAGRARGATAYVTLEPCCHQGRTGPCAARLIDAGVARVVYAVGDPNPAVAGGGERALRDAGVAVEKGLMQAAARMLNRGFFSRHERGRPYLVTKIATSLDGRTALASGASKWITSAQARADVQRLRATASAILTGSGTVIADDPRLTVRLPDDGSWHPPARIVIDSMLRTPPTAKILTTPGAVMVATVADAPREAAAALAAAGARVERLADDDGGGRVGLTELLSVLAKLEYNEVLVEAGSGLNGALLAAGLLDEIIVYQAPVVLGPDARPMFDIAPLTDMAARPAFEILSTRQVGPDWRLRLRAGSL